jgi:signal transduction histidine kinase
MNELTLITLGYAASMLLGAGFGLFVLLQNPRKGANQTFFLMCLSLAGFQLSFILGANTGDPALAYLFWLANIVDVFLAIFYLHFIVLALEALPRFRVLLYLDYAIGLAILGATLVSPHSFLPTVVPKLYFRTYLEGGPLYVLMLAFFLLSFAFSFAVMFLERARHSEEGKRRIDYYIFSLFYGFATGITAFPLVFNFRIDPLPSLLIGTFVIPMVYGMVKKDLLDIRIVVKRTILFTLAIGALTAVLTTLPFLSNILSMVIPGAAFWLVPLLIALAAVGAGTLYWRKAEEAERLKYEFITVAAHKFRTPLTRIRWASEALLTRTDLTPDARELVNTMRTSDLELIQLSNLLMDAARLDKDSYSYVEVPLSLEELAAQAVAVYHDALKEKRITLVLNPPPPLPEVKGDKERLLSAMSVLLENAIAYTPAGGTITVALSAGPDQVRFSVTDTGIGVSSEEARHIFKKFYRTDRARHADTEGVGLGLHMAKSIIERHRGSIGVESKGAGQGSTFWFTLPL